MTEKAFERKIRKLVLQRVTYRDGNVLDCTSTEVFDILANCVLNTVNHRFL
jgi:hypothetical protein